MRGFILKNKRKIYFHSHHHKKMELNSKEKTRKQPHTQKILSKLVGRKYAGNIYEISRSSRNIP